MKIGDLVRGEINGLMGFVTHVMDWGSQTYVRVYWFEIQHQTGGWLHTYDLEVLCK